MPKRVKVKLLERPRNRLVLEAIALKGGEHGRSDKAVRRDERQEARKAGREAWASREGQTGEKLFIFKSLLIV